MSLNEEIARLTGRLVFEVDSRQLHRFQSLMTRSTQQMAQLGAQYNKLAASMNKSLKLKLNVDTSEINKAKAKLNNSLSREHRAEVALGNQRRTTFAAELSQQKLQYAGTKQQYALGSEVLASQREGAIVAAKAHATQMRAKGVTKSQLASQNALTASLTKQARLEAIAAKTRATTQKASAAHLKSMNQIQRIQQVINQAQTTAQQRAAKHTVQLASLQLASANKVTNQAQKDQRFQWAQARQQQWQANQNSKSSQSGFGAMGGLMALGGIGGALGGLTLAIGALSNRMKERQAGVEQAEGFNNTFMSISKNPEIVKAYRESFIRSQNENGGAIDTDTAKDFRTMAINMGAAGKSLEQINDTWNVRQQAFSVAGTTKEDNKELNKQLGQMASDGTGAASDANIINDRMPMLTPYVVREYMKDKGITDYNKGLGAYTKDLKGGKGVKFAWYEEGMKKLVKDNGESLERNRNGVASAQQRADNQAYLNTNNINSDAELSQVIKDRIQAERELNEAMQPLKTTLAQFDIALTGVMTGALRMMVGKNADGTEKSDQQLTQERMTTADLPVSLGMVGTHDYSNVDGNSQHQGGPIGNFWNWVLGVEDKRDSYKKQAGDLSNTAPDIWNQKESPYNQAVVPGFLPQLELNMENWQKQADAFSRVQEAGKAVDPTNQPPVGVLAPASTTTIAPVVNIEGPKINIELHGKANEEDSALVMTKVTQELDKRDANIPQIVDRALGNIIGNARSTQSQTRQ
jgi:hypothetical protein